MRVAEFVIDLGRTVAYYPSLKKITGSATSTILLCQLLYWTNKAKDGWIWKTTSEIEEETGLTSFKKGQSCFVIATKFY